MLENFLECLDGQDPNDWSKVLHVTGARIARSPRDEEEDDDDDDDDDKTPSDNDDDDDDEGYSE